MTIAGDERCERAVVTSEMFKLAKPIPAVTENEGHRTQTHQPASAVVCWRHLRCPAAIEGRARAAQSAATPTAKKSEPTDLPTYCRHAIFLVPFLT